MTSTPGPDRRTFLRASGLAGGGLVAGGLVAGGLVGGLVGRSTSASEDSGSGPTSTGNADSSTGPSSSAAVSFYGDHQAGVVDRAPAQLRFIAFDLLRSTGTAARPALEQLLRRLTSAAAQLMAGRWITEQIEAPAGLRPAALTITVGLGAQAVAVAGAGVPAALTPIPAFAGDTLLPGRSGGDIGVQVCGEDPFVVASAAQAISVVIAPFARPRWIQTGFLPGVSAAADATATPRNLMGQLDGTDNPSGSRLELAVWVDDPLTPWMTGGSYLVCRRVRMLLLPWRQLPLAARARAVGRAIDTGAPLTGGTEHATPDFIALDAAGQPVIATDSHLRLTHPANNSGATMLRRGYSYDDGLRSDGTPDAGLFFQCFQTDPQKVFVPIQRKLAATDALTRFLRHESSAVFAVLPGVAEGHWLGEEVFQ